MSKEASDAVHLNDDQAQRVYKAERERDALRKDAERYRWLRKPRNEWQLKVFRSSFWQSLHNRDLDEAIDNAMDEGRGK
jgi:hypothetical protein